MKKIYLLALSVCVFLSSFYLSAYNIPEGASYPFEKARETYRAGLKDFTIKTSRLYHLASVCRPDQASMDDLRKAHSQARISYKKIEYLAAYVDEEFVNDYINGAPLHKLERNSPQLSVLEPKGLQTLEEMLYDEEFPDKELLIKLTKGLNDSAERLRIYSPTNVISDRILLEAIRINLIRLFSLGLTGFDTPGVSEKHALPEAKVSLNASYLAFKSFLPIISQKDEELAGRLEQNFQEAIAILDEAEDFNSFDRLDFLRNYVEPIFRDIKKAHYALGIETWKETDRRFVKRSLNYEADHIFSEKLLNPYHFMQLEEEKYTDETVALGRYLFFDPILSGNNQSSCASCHKPEMAFTDGRAKSLAMNGDGNLDRNAPTLLNSVFADRYFYDLRTDVLENQIAHVVTDSREFHTSYLEIFEKLSSSREYTVLFHEAFPEVKNNPIQKYTVAAAIAAYIRSLTRFDSPFDRYARGESELLDASAKRGFNLFMGKAACGTCHFAPVFNGSVPPLFQESESEVLGVPANSDLDNPIADKDPGRAEGVMKERTSIYNNSFKTTTVRNIALTGPYMHNGVFSTLEEVLDFYDRGGGAGIGLEVPNQTLSPDPLELTDREKQDIISFMKALTDTTGLTSKPNRLPEVEGVLTAKERKVGGEY
ncbi:cytochrome-c peroxidase [Roseivirga sp. BDSF3-8]|uniref:cytochrome-c peroxidase n=1 Tax=Roseivirga sp. BDSF3-8 TaxID=3241598 RepID=UPI0035324EEB